ncbi:MAG: peptidase C14, partial [Dehalococcoidia bacterium]
GWYDEDSDATISIESIQEPSVRRNFTGWSGDYTGNEETVSFVMGSPKTVKANWQSEYLLTIESAYGEPGGAGWYDEGSTTTISVRESVGVLVRHLFTGWSGDVTSGAPTAMLVVDSPVKVTAEWRTDYTYLILLIVGVVVIIGILATTIIMLRRHSKKAV